MFLMLDTPKPCNSVWLHGFFLIFLMKKCPRLRTLLVTVPFYLTVKVLLFIGKVFHLSYNAVNIIIWYMIKLTPTSRVKTFVCNFTAVCTKWTRSAKRWCQKEVAVLYNFFLCYVAICHNDGVTLWIKS